MKLGRASSYHFRMPGKKLRQLYNFYDVDSLETKLSPKKSHVFKAGQIIFECSFSSTSSFDLELFSTMNIDQTI